ncbi:MAG: hypothetical protein JJE22_06600, partial [Bacteroidia bacterium]|nr:hypothetical protein [Bacteroidia bacterium]
LLTVKDFLSVSSLTPKKFYDYIYKRNFVLTGRDWQNDTIVNTFILRMKRNVTDTQHVTRAIDTYQSGKNFSYAFQTSSGDDYTEARKELKKEGFFCSNEDDSTSFFLYQQKNITVLVNMKIDAYDTLYTFHFYKKELPQLEKIHFAEDLFPFTSHEYLVSVFGEQNVKKDVYYFSEKEITKCSVLFPYTNRQAVFIWNDEANRCGLSSILIGGNLSNKSSINYDQVIGENTWVSKEGIYSGMSITNLAKLNGKDFGFYGKNSEFPLMVVPENTGKVNFKRSVVVLGCLSNNGSLLLNQDIIKANEVLQDNPGIFILMFMVSPSKDGE